MKIPEWKVIWQVQDANPILPMSVSGEHESSKSKFDLKEEEKEEFLASFKEYSCIFYRNSLDLVELL